MWLVGFSAGLGSCLLSSLPQTMVTFSGMVGLRYINTQGCRPPTQLLGVSEKGSDVAVDAANCRVSGCRDDHGTTVDDINPALPIVRNRPSFP